VRRALRRSAAIDTFARSLATLGLHDRFIGWGHQEDRSGPAAGGSRRAQRRFPDVAAHEFAALQLLQDAGIGTAKPVLLSDTYLVLEYLAGEGVTAHPDPIRYCGQLATALARIHGITTASHDLDFLRPHSDWLQTRLDASTRFDDAGLANRLRRALTASWQTIAAPPTTLLHGDFWSGNVLMDGDEIAGSSAQTP
jgi:aminoglycoside phosphotransferase (APT) family kinase protein